MLRRPRKRTSAVPSPSARVISRSLAVAMLLVNAFPFRCQVPSRLARCGLRIDQRHLCQLQVDHQSESPIDLKKQCCLPAR